MSFSLFIEQNSSYLKISEQILYQNVYIYKL